MIRDVHWPGWSRHLGLGHPAHGPRTTQLNLTSAERDVSGSLSLVTKEGDTVTLSASFDASVTYAGLRRRGHGEGGFRMASREVHSSLSLQVQGDLSAQELAEIREVVRRFMHDLRGLVRGRDESIADVADVSATTLTSISATATTQETLTLISLAGRGPLRPAPARPALPLGTPQDGPAAPATPAAEDAELAAGGNVLLAPRPFEIQLPTPYAWTASEAKGIQA